jgi:hypothetical protein
VRFRGILQSKDTQRLEIGLVDAQQSGIYAVQRFARTLRRDLTVVSYALTETLEQWPHQRTNEPVENRSRGMLAVQALNYCGPGYCRSPYPSVTQSEDDPY